MTSQLNICSSCGQNGGGYKFCVLCGAPQTAPKSVESSKAKRPVKQNSTPRVAQTMRETTNSQDDSTDSQTSTLRIRKRTGSESDIQVNKSPQKTIECGKCKKPFTSGGFIQSQGKYFHKECLRCATCKIQLFDAFFERDGNYYCERDFAGLIIPNCKQCNKQILDEVRTVEGNTYHTECFKCSSCGEVLNEFTKINGKYCHPKCGHSTAPILQPKQKGADISTVKRRSLEKASVPAKTTAHEAKSLSRAQTSANVRNLYQTKEPVLPSSKSESNIRSNTISISQAKGKQRPGIPSFDTPERPSTVRPSSPDRTMNEAPIRKTASSPDERPPSIDSAPYTVWGRLSPATPNVKAPSLALTKGEYTIGASNKCDVIIKDVFISKIHCKLIRTPKGFFVEDKSTNGTYVNGILIGQGESIEVKHGDEISLAVPDDFVAKKDRVARYAVTFEEPFKAPKQNPLRGDCIVM